MWQSISGTQRDRRVKQFLDVKTVWFHDVTSESCPITSGLQIASSSCKTIYVSAQRFRVCPRNLNKTPHIDVRQTAPRPPGTWPHGNPLSITCSVCLVPVSVPLSADLLQGRGAEWVVCQGSEWLIYSRLWSEGVEPTQAAPHGLGLGPGLLLLLLLLHLLRES